MHIDLALTLLSGAQGPGPRARDPIGTQGPRGAPLQAQGRSERPLWDALGQRWDAQGRSGKLWDGLGRSGTLWDALSGSCRTNLTT